MVEPQDSHVARNEAVAAVRPLVTAEETRSTNLNTRALGVISASSVVTAIAAFFAKDVLGGTSLQNLGASKTPAVVLLIFAVTVLAATVLCGVYTLWPRTKAFIEPDGMAGWAQPGGQIGTEAAIREQTLRDLAAYLLNVRSFNDGKVKRLKATYVLYALAVLAIAVDAMLFFISAL